MHHQKKTCWKNLVKNATSNYWYKEWFKDKIEKSSIQYQLQNNPIHNPHNIWKVVNHRSKDVKKAQVKVKLITNTYSLQSLRAKYNQHAVKPTCVICDEGDEDIEHFILKCKGLNTTRMVYLEKLEFDRQYQEGWISEIRRRRFDTTASAWCYIWKHTWVNRLKQRTYNKYRENNTKSMFCSAQWAC